MVSLKHELRNKLKIVASILLVALGIATGNFWAQLFMSGIGLYIFLGAIFEIFCTDKNNSVSSK